MSTPVRVRFAPSPTGFLHIGGLRTALFNYLFARHHGGTFVLRIEDTDQARFVDGAEADIVRALEWCGIAIDEGPHAGGPHGPYRQSERGELYAKAAAKLIEEGHAYYAFDTQEEIETMRERLRSSGNPSPAYDSITRQSMKNSLTLPQEEVERRLASGEAHVVRLKVPRRETVRFEDRIRGVVSFETKGLDDQVLMKSDGLPTYHLANVVDDHEMGITHVIRGEEWLSSAPKHMLLYRYLGWEPPVMAHLPLIMSPSGGKLSKRKAEMEGIPVNARDYIDHGYEPQALVNFLAYLGWSPGDDSEIHSLEELAGLFTLERVGKAGAVFSHKKLLWYNEHYLRQVDDEALYTRVLALAAEQGVTGFDPDVLRRAVPLLKERITRAEEILTLGAFFLGDPEHYDPDALGKWQESTPDLLRAYRKELESLTEAQFEAPLLKERLQETAKAHGAGMGKLMMPVRVCVSGLGFGPDLFDSMELLGRETVLRRMELALARLSGPGAS